MPPTFIPFDGWAPSGGFFGEGWGTVSNVYQRFGDWRPWRIFSPTAGSIAAGTMIGTHVHVWASGLGTGTYVPDSQTIFCGSVNGANGHLYVIDPVTGVFTDVSLAALYAANSAGWRFASVGNDIWAANGINQLQRRTNNAGLFANGAVSTFKPQPRFIRTIREHLISANLSNAGRFQDEIAWSDADDATNYDPPAGGSTSISIAGSKRLTSISGQITGLVGGQYGLAFKQSCIYYLEYTGDQQVFRPDILSTNVGTAWPSSIIKTRYGIFFLGADGFYRISGLSEPQKVSPPGVDQYLLDSGFTQNLYLSNSAGSEDSQAIAFQAPGWPMVGWSLRANYTDYGNDFAILYNPVTDTWSRTDTVNVSLFPRVTALINRPYSSNNNYESLAAITFDTTTSRYAPLSASVGQVFAPVLGLNFRPANFDTATRQGQSKITSILPIFSSAFGVGGTPLTESITVEALLDPAGTVWKTETAVAANRDAVSGAYPFQIAGRLFRVTINCAAEDFATFEGIYVDQELLK